MAFVEPIIIINRGTIVLSKCILCSSDNASLSQKLILKLSFPRDSEIFSHRSLWIILEKYIVYKSHN
jgi:hypothetical protein